MVVAQNVSNFDTTLRAVTGLTVDVLTTIASADDGGMGLNSRVAFPVQSGVTYHIAVDGFGGESGDIVLVRTGMMTRCLAEQSWQGYCGGPAPGLSVHCASWLYEREIAAACSDTCGLEVLPNETDDCFQPLHMISLRNTGVLFGEIFAMDALADACAEDKRYSFLFTAPPLPITGAVGSPINPLAIR